MITDARYGSANAAVADVPLRAMIRCMGYGSVTCNAT
jgi:hypothetical protein